MASAYSILRNYGDYVTPVDFNLIQQGLEFKQQKFDANTALIQSQIDQFANLQLAKGQDKEYLNERINTLVDQVNEFGAVDLSSNGVTRNIQNHVKQVLDDKVINAYSGTKALQRYQEEVAYYKKNKPEQYSQLNEAYGGRGAQAWLNDGEVGTTFSGATYTPFENVSKNKQDLLTKLYKDSKSKMTIPQLDEQGNPTGRMIEKEFKGFTDDEIGGLFETTLSDTEKKQLEINAWAKFGQNPSQTIGLYNNYVTNRQTEINNALKLAKENGDTANIDYYSKLSTSFNDTVKELGETEQDKVKNVTAIGRLLEKESMLGGLKSQFRKRRINFEYKNDAAFWASKKDARENIKLGMKVNGSNSSRLTNDKGSNSLGITANVDIVRRGGDVQGTASKEELFQEKVETTRKVANASVQRLLSSPAFTAQSAELRREAADYTATHKGVTEEEALIDVVDRYIANNPSAYGKEVEHYKLASKAFRDGVRDEVTLYNKTKERVKETVSGSVGLVFENFNHNIREKYNKVLGFDLVTDDEFNAASSNGRRQVRESDLTEEQKRQVQRVMLADVINTKRNNGDTEAYGYFLDALAESFGETASYEVNERKVGDVETSAFGINTTKESNNRRIQNKIQPKTAKFLESTVKNGVFNTPNIGFDNSILEDDGFSGLATASKIQEYRNQFLSGSLTDNLGSKALSFSPQVIKGVPKRTIEQQAVFNTIGQALTDGTTEFIIDGERESIESEEAQEILQGIKLKTDSTVIVDVAGGGTGTTKIELPDGTKMLVRTELVMNNLSKAGVNVNLASIDRDAVFLDSNRKSEEIPSFLTQAQLDERVSYLTESLGEISQSIAPLNSGAPSPLNTLTRRQSERMLLRSHSINSEQAQAIGTIMDNTSELVTSLKLEGGNIIMQVGKKDGSPALFSNATPVSNFASVQEAHKRYSELVKIQTVAPQFFIHTMLDMVASDEGLEKQTGDIPDYSFRDILEGLQQTQQPTQ